MKLADELALYGSGADPEAFREVLQELHAIMHPAWTSEQLLYRPADALRFCEAVRARCGPGLPDEAILRRLTNLRKHGQDRPPGALAGD